MKYFIRTFFTACLFFLCVFHTGAEQKAFAAKKLHINISTDHLKIGEQAVVSVEEDGVTKYHSNNSDIACISSDGIITAKREGTVTIHANQTGYRPAKIQLKIKKGATKPILPVALTEIKLIQQKLHKKDDHHYIYSARVKNKAQSGNIRKLEYIYAINVLKTKNSKKEKTIETVSNSAIEDTLQTEKTTKISKIVHLTFKNIKANKTSSTATCKGDFSGKLENMQLKKIKLYTGNALYIYNADDESYTLKWGTKDTTPPVISGWVKSDSAYSGHVVRVCYSDRKDSYDFTDHVSVVDERDPNVKLKVDTSDINWDKKGVYKIKYSAKDTSGNKAASWAKVQVYVPETAENIADEILSTIIEEDWTDLKKAKTIYTYVRSHCYYVNTGAHSRWRSVAINGIRYHSGDCYTYYSMARLLLSRAGIPNLTVTRYPAREGAHHWWNLVYVKGGWYHYDTAPRSHGGTFCLNTDQQMDDYYPGSYIFKFRGDILPERATKVISPTPQRK